MTTTLRALAPLLLLLLARPASASEYAVDAIPQAIVAADAERLKAAGIATTTQLLERGTSSKAREALAQSTKIPRHTLDGLVQMSDLLRIKGVGPDVVRLLDAAGVKTVAKLKSQDAARLYGEITSLNEKRHLSENPPSAEHLQAWIAQAQTLPIVLQ